MVDLDDRSALARAQRRGEQRIGDCLVRPLDASARRDDRPAILTEIDGDAVGAEQLGNALDRRVERVREGQASDRLADDRQQCPAPLELEPGLTGALRRTERVRGADGEAGELRACPLVRRAARRKAQLQRADRRLAQLQRHRLALAPVAAHRHRPLLLLDGRARDGLEPRIRLDRAMATLGLELSATQAPHERCFRSCSDHGEPGDAPGGALVVGDGGERVSGDVQGTGALTSRRAPVLAESCGEPGQVGCESRDERRLALERPAAAHELEHPGRAVPLRAEH